MSTPISSPSPERSRVAQLAQQQSAPEEAKQAPLPQQQETPADTGKVGPQISKADDFATAPARPVPSRPVSAVSEEAKLREGFMKPKSAPAADAVAAAPQSFAAAPLRLDPDKIASRTIGDLKADVQFQMQRLAQSPQRFHEALRQIYKHKLSPQKSAQLLEQARRGEFPLPANVHFVDSGTLQGNNAAYSATTDTVYLNKNLMDDFPALQKAFREECGHALDRNLGEQDTRGDEGRAFLGVLEHRGPLSRKELEEARGHRDQGTIVMDGKPVAVEFQQAEPQTKADYGSMRPRDKMNRLAEELRGAPEQRNAALQEIRKTKSEELGRCLGLAEPEARVAVLKELAGKDGTLTPQLKGALDQMRSTDRAALLQEVFGRADASMTGKALNEYLEGNPQIGSEVVAGLSAMEPAKLAESLQRLSSTALGNALARMENLDLTQTFDKLAKAGDGPARDRLFAALDRMQTRDRARVLATVAEAGQREPDLTNGRSLAAEYLTKNPKRAADLAQNAGPEYQGAIRNLISTETNDKVRRASLATQGPIDSAKVERLSEEILGHLNRPLRAALAPVPGLNWAVDSAHHGDVAAITRTLKDANLTPAEMDAVLNRVKARGESFFVRSLSSSLDSAPDQDLRAFSELIAAKGGPDSKAIGLQLLTDAYKSSVRDDRETMLREGMVQIANSRQGDILESRTGATSIRNAVRALLDGDDARPTTDILNRMTTGLPPWQMAKMDEAIKDGFKSYIDEKTGGSVLLDILKSVELRSDGKIQAQLAVDVEGGEGGKHKEYLPWSTTGQFAVAVNPGKILEQEAVRDVRRALEQFEGHMKERRDEFHDNPRDLALYDQLLQDWKQADEVGASQRLPPSQAPLSAQEPKP